MTARTMERRADLRSVDDAKFKMRHARRRYQAERTAGIPSAMHGLRAWVRKTYQPAASAGKLHDVVRRSR